MFQHRLEPRWTSGNLCIVFPASSRGECYSKERTADKKETQNLGKIALPPFAWGLRASAAGDSIYQLFWPALNSGTT